MPLCRPAKLTPHPRPPTPNPPCTDDAGQSMTTRRRRAALASQARPQAAPRTNVRNHRDKGRTHPTRAAVTNTCQSPQSPTPAERDHADWAAQPADCAIRMRRERAWIPSTLRPGIASGRGRRDECRGGPVGGGVGGGAPQAEAPLAMRSPKKPGRGQRHSNWQAGSVCVTQYLWCT